MSGFLVDSDVIIDVMNGVQQASDAYYAAAAEGVTVSLISYGEVFQGAYYGRNAESDLRMLDALIDPIDLLGIDRATMRQFGKLRGSLSRQIRNQLGDFDLLIAATALEHDRILLTGNVKDFQHVSGLEIADYRQI